MKFNLYDDVKVFYNDVYDVLMKHEVQNIIPLGNVIMGNAGQDKTDWRDPVNWFMATVTDGDGIRLTAIMTPPFNLTLYMTENENNEAALACLADGLLSGGFSVGGVMTEKALAEDFTRIYAKAAGVQHRIAVSLRCFELMTVNPDVPTPGELRLLDESDMHFYPYWSEGFMSDAFHKPFVVQEDIEVYRYQLSKKSKYVLEVDGKPVTMGAITREMQNVCSIAGVYTPPYFRGKGYASSYVAQLSQIILNRGFSRAVLYTDLANPTSNSIYQKIGYVPVCDNLEIKFE